MEKKFNIELIGATVERETEKAIFVELEIDTQSGRKARKVWFPKSQSVVEDGKVKITEWIYNRKCDEIQQDIVTRLGDHLSGWFTGLIAAPVN